MEVCLRNHDLLKIIFSFVGNGGDFRSLEKTCKDFRDVLQDDEIWGYCPKKQYASAPKLLNREIVLNEMLLKYVDRWQRKERDSILLSVLGHDGIEKLVDGMIEWAFNHLHFPGGIGIDLRGDTVATLINIVEANAISQLDRAFLLAVHRHEESKSSVFPTVTKTDFLLQDKLHNPNGTMGFSQSILLCPTCKIPHAIDDESLPEGLLVSEADKQTIACRMAYRAGFVKMEQAVNRLLWTSLIMTSGELLKQPFLFLVETCQDISIGSDFRRFYLSRDREIEPVPKRTINEMETIRSVAPFPWLGEHCCPTCRKIGFVYTIVPKQIEDAAQRLRLPVTTVYGNDWFIDEDKDDGEEALAVAQRHYNFNSCKDDTEIVELENDGENTKEKKEVFMNLVEPAMKKRKVDSGPARLDAGESLALEHHSETSEGDEEDSRWDDESDDDDDDEYPEAFVDAARRWNPNVYKSCTHPFGYVPFQTVPDIDSVETESFGEAFK